MYLVTGLGQIFKPRPKVTVKPPPKGPTKPAPKAGWVDAAAVHRQVLQARTMNSKGVPSHAHFTWPPSMSPMPSPYSRIAPVYDCTVGFPFFLRRPGCFERLVRRYGIRFGSAADIGCVRDCSHVT